MSAITYRRNTKAITPPGFDYAASAGAQPTLRIFLPPDPEIGARYVASSAESALRALAGQSPPAQIQIVSPAENPSDQSIVDRLGLRSYMVLVTVILLIAMISVLVVPIVLAEEVEKKTIDALVLVASYADVIAAKALVGIAFIAISIGIQLSFTRLDVANYFMFATTVLVLSLTLLGFGLFMAGFFKSANQLNTWAGFVLIPLIMPAVLVGARIGGVVDAVFYVLPASQGMRLLSNAVSGEDIFSDVWFGYIVILLWGVLAFFSSLPPARPPPGISTC